MFNLKFQNRRIKFHIVPKKVRQTLAFIANRKNATMCYESLINNTITKSFEGLDGVAVHLTAQQLLLAFA